jgi:hypothetical protein
MFASQAGKTSDPYIEEINMVVTAVIFLVLCVLVALFQLALTLGAPWGEYTMGGKFPGQLPLKMRIAALFQILILFVMACIVLIRSGVVVNQFYDVSKTAIWFVVSFFIIGSILNLLTPSQKERAVWGPVNILLFVLSIIVAVST